MHVGVVFELEPKQNQCSIIISRAISCYFYHNHYIYLETRAANNNKRIYTSITTGEALSSKGEIEEIYNVDHSECI